jgi:hypothetical protein
MVKPEGGNLEKLLRVKLKHVPAPGKKRVTLADVCFDAGPRGTVAVKVSASTSPSWTVQHGQPLPFDHAKHFFPDDVTERDHYRDGA